MLQLSSEISSSYTPLKDQIANAVKSLSLKYMKYRMELNEDDEYTLYKKRRSQIIDLCPNAFAPFRMFRRQVKPGDVIEIDV